MLYISHRGNLEGVNPKDENRPDYVINALNNNFHVEVDTWLIKDTFFLGHDNAEYPVNIEFIKNKNLWFHAKNINAFHKLLKLKVICFWHQNDDVTLTSNGFIWTYAGKELTQDSICVLPEINNIEKVNCAGICSDYIMKYSNE